MVAIALVLAFATMVKPAAGIFFWLVIAVALIFRRPHWRALVDASLLYVSIMLMWSCLYWANSPARVAPTNPNAQTQGLMSWLAENPQAPFLGPPNAYVGYHALMKFYRYREYLETGQAGARDWLIGARRPNLVPSDFFDGFNADVPAACMAEFNNDRARFMAWLRNPAWHSKACTGSAMGWLFHWMQTTHGEEQAGRIMARTAAHIALTEPMARRILLGDWLQAAFFPSGETLPPRDFAGLHDQTEAQLRGSIEGGAVNDLPNGLRWPIGTVAERNAAQRAISTLLELQYETFRAAKPWLVGLMVLSFVPLLRRRGSGVAFTTFVLLAYLASATIWVVAMIMPGSDPRHEDVYSFLPLLVIAFGASAFARGPTCA